MKAWVYDRNLDGIPIEGSSDKVYLVLKDKPIPTIEDPNTILGRVIRTSECGTDIPLVTGKFKHAESGITPGHEMCIEVVDRGKKVKGKDPETLLAVESHYIVQGTEAEEEGIIGLWGPKTKDNIYSRPMNGSFAEYVLVMDYCTYEIPRQLLDHFCPSLLEAGGNDYLIAKYLKENKLLGKVAIVGCGQHGLYTQMFAKYMGCELLAAFEIDPKRIEFTGTFGQADVILDSRDTYVDQQVQEYTQGQGFDSVVDTAAKSRKTLKSCVDMLKEEGTLILFGLYDEVDVPLLREETTGKNHAVNDIIFGQLEFRTRLNEKNFYVRGITGRKGVWEELISLVTNRKDIRAKMMELVPQVKSLDELLHDLTHPCENIRKLAYFGH